MKKTCYDCAYKANVPGDAHISCRFKWSGSELNPPLANETGIKKGWYTFPINFDPAWQEEECKAWNDKKEEEKYINEFNPLLALLSLFVKW